MLWFVNFHLTNRSGCTVLVEGYRSEPYVRITARAVAGYGPGHPGIALRVHCGSELVLMVAVLGATLHWWLRACVRGRPTLLCRHNPRASAPRADRRPARAGRNAIHIYLFERRHGRHLEGVKG